MENVFKILGILSMHCVANTRAQEIITYKEYQVISQRKTYSDAQQHCKRLNGNMARMSKQNEKNGEIKEALSNAKGLNMAWVLPPFSDSSTEAYNPGYMNGNPGPPPYDNRGYNQGYTGGSSYGAEPPYNTGGYDPAYTNGYPGPPYNDERGGGIRPPPKIEKRCTTIRKKIGWRSSKCEDWEKYAFICEFNRKKILTDVVYVDGTRGTDVNICGRKASPCKTLLKLLPKIRTSGTIYINGEISESGEFDISKSLTIRGVHGANFDTIRNTKFEVSENGDVAFRSLRLESVTITANRLNSLIISHCRLTSVSIDIGTVNNIAIFDTSLNQHKLLKVENVLDTLDFHSIIYSTYYSLGDIDIGRAHTVKLMNSSFNKVNSIHIKAVTSTVTVHWCTFNTINRVVQIGTRGGDVKGKAIISHTRIIDNRQKGLTIDSLATATIINCTLTKTFLGIPLRISRTSAVLIRNVSCEYNRKGGGCVSLERTESISVAHSKFVSNSETAIKIKQSATISIKNCLFSKNAKSVSVDNSPKMSNQLTITDCTFTQNTGASITTRGCNNNVASITNCVFIAGGTVALSGHSYIRITNSILRNNTGGAIHLTNFINASVTDVIFKGNNAQYGSSILASGSSKRLCNIQISKCVFTKSSSEDNGGAVSVKECVVNLDTAVLSKNNAQDGGALYLESSITRLNHCTFKNNVAYSSGGSIATSNPIDGKFNVEIINCIFEDNVAGDDGGAIQISGYELHMSTCQLISNRANNGGALSIESSVVDIVNCTFNHNTANGIGGALANQIKNTTQCQVKILHSKISGSFAKKNGGAFALARCIFDVTDSLFTENRAYDGGALHLQRDVKAMITNCFFLHNTAEYTGGALVASNLEGHGAFVKIANCELTNNSAVKLGGAMMIKRSNFEMINTTLKNNRAEEGGAVVLDSENIPSSIARFSRCSFLRNTASSIGGAMRIARYNKENLVRIQQCSFINGSSFDSGAGLFVRDAKIELIGSRMYMSVSERNNGGAGLYMLSHHQGNGSAVIIKSAFYDSPVYIKTQAISVENSTFAIRNGGGSPAHIEFQAFQIKLKSVRTNTSYSKPLQSNVMQSGVKLTADSLLEIENGFDFTCTSNFNVETSFVSHKMLEVNCKTCNPNMYTLTNTLLFTKFTDEVLRMIPKCLPCLPGTVCDGTIKVLDNFWGMKGQGNELTLLPCPRGFCCSSNTRACDTYNTCAKGRTGILCGTCKKNYIQSFLKNKCIKKNDIGCNLLAFAAFFFIASMVYTIIFTFLPKFIEICREAISRCKVIASKKTEAEVLKDDELNIRVSDNDKELNEDDNTAYKSVVDALPAVGSANPIPISAYITQVVFYFQIASLVHINISQQNLSTSTDRKIYKKITKAIFDIFNFRMSMYKEVCPVENSTIIHKMLINLCLKISTMFNLIWFILLWKCWKLACSLVSRKAADKSEVSYQSEGEVILVTSLHVNDDRISLKSNGSNDAPLQPSFTRIIKIGFLKLSKLNFTAIVAILFNLVHCEEMQGHFHLYKYGDHLCYDWWQYLIMFFILPALALFPLSLGLSLDLLKKRLISTNTFLMAYTIPFFALVLHLRWKHNHLCRKEFDPKEEACIKEILALEETLFKEDEKSLRWTVVQLYRNLLVVIFRTFILNSVYKTLWFFLIFLVFLAHDWYRQPFKHPFLNLVQPLTSGCLLLINVCNAPASFSSVGNIMAIPNMSMCVEVLMYLELLLYFIVPASLPLWRLVQWVQTQNCKTKKP